MDANNTVQEPVIPNQVNQQPNQEEPFKQKNYLLPIIGIVSLILVVGVGSYYFGKSTTPKSSPAPVITSQPSQSSPTPNSPDETANWITYTNEKYGFSFQYPSSLEEKYGELTSSESDGDQGKLLGGSFSKDVFPQVFAFSGTTTDFAAGREELATIGFEKSDKRIFYKFYTNSQDITDSVIKAFINKNGVEVVIFDRSVLHWAFEGQIGAVINLKNQTYPGIDFRIDPTRLDLKTFEQILSTFKFTQ